MPDEIIIDGIDVSGCEFYFENNGIIAPDRTAERTNICSSPEKSCKNSDICDCNKQCYYKQLKRLEAENARLKAEIDTWKYQTEKRAEIGDIWYDIAQKYKTCLQKIKEIAEPIYEDYSKRWDDFITEGLEQILQLIKESESAE